MSEINYAARVLSKLPSIPEFSQSWIWRSLCVALIIAFCYPGALIVTSAAQEPTVTGGDAQAESKDANDRTAAEGLRNELFKLRVPSWVGDRRTEPFDVKAFLEPYISENEKSGNAAPEYLRALTAISPSRARSTKVEDLPADLAAAQELSDAIDRAADSEKLTSGEIPLQEVQRIERLARPAIELLDQAQLKPNCVFASTLETYQPAGHAHAMLSLKRLTLLELFAARIDKDFAKTYRSLARILKASRDLRPAGDMIHQLTSNAIDSHILQLIAECCLSQPGLTVENCNQLISLLVMHDKKGLDRVKEGVRVEYIIARNTLQLLQMPVLGYEYLVNIFGNEEISLSRNEFANVKWDLELATCDKVTAGLLAGIGKKQMETPSEWDQETQSQLRVEGTQIMPSISHDYDQIFEAFRRCKARLAGTIALSAVQRYQLAHGQLPSDLTTALREAKIGEPVLDPYDGEQIRYRIIDGKAVVYSVGRDRIDQGGMVDWQFGKVPGDLIMTIKN